MRSARGIIRGARLEFAIGMPLAQGGFIQVIAQFSNLLTVAAILRGERHSSSSLEARPNLLLRSY